MDYKLALGCALVLFILSCPWLMPEYCQYVLWGFLLGSVGLLCIDYAKNCNVASKVLKMLGEIPLKTTLQGWMSNVIQWTGVTIQRFFLIFLGFIPILIQVYYVSLLNCYLVYLAIVWWIFVCFWNRIQHKYFAHIHPPLKWIIKSIFKSIFQTTYFILVAVLYFATRDGFFNWGFVKLHECTLHLSSSMEVRNCNAHVDMIIKFDNYTSSQTQFVKFCDEFGIISKFF
jgi:hypothetical protein